MPRAFPHSLLLVLATAGCTVGPATPAPEAPAPVALNATLGFRRVITAASAAVFGEVRAPAAMLDDRARLVGPHEENEAAPAIRLNEVAVPDAQVTVLDLAGTPVVGRTAIRTDRLGRFALDKLDGGRPYMVQATFTDRHGQPRVLRALAIPATAGGCLALTLATTVVAGKAGATAAQLQPAELAQLVTVAQARLPAILDVENQHGAALSSETEALLNELTSDQPDQAAPLIDRLIANDPVFQTTWQTVAVSSLEVTFSIQHVPQNVAQFLTPERIGRPLSGKIELVCKTEAPSPKTVSFWLDNRKMTEAVASNGMWVATLDTTTVPDGPYVLTALDESAARKTKAFVYVDNAAGPSGSPCGTAN